jgi:hypothetical protein
MEDRMKAAEQELTMFKRETAALSEGFNTAAQDIPASGPAAPAAAKPALPGLSK